MLFEAQFAFPVLDKLTVTQPLDTCDEEIALWPEVN